MIHSPLPATKGENMGISQHEVTSPIARHVIRLQENVFSDETWSEMAWLDQANCLNRWIVDSLEMTLPDVPVGNFQEALQELRSYYGAW